MDPALAKMQYIKKKVDPILSKLMVDLLVTEPAEPVEFMITWLTNRKDFLTKRESPLEHQNNNTIEKSRVA